MNAGRFLVATLIGGIALFVVGGLIWGLALANAYPPTPIDRETFSYLGILVGQFAWAAALTAVIASRAGGPAVGGGFKIGALLGFFVQIHIAVMFLSTTTLPVSTMTYVDPLLAALWSGIGGAVVGWWLARGDAGSAAVA